MMPKLRGIAVSVLAHWDQSQYLEFPHPENSRYSSTKRRSDLDSAESQRSSFESSASSSHMDMTVGESAISSVYIPSVPGARFLLRYTISPPYEPGVHVYFKLFMNGRHINSWGVNPRLKPRGHVTRALFLTGETRKTEVDGIPTKQGGTEARTLRFASSVEEQSAAHDGGLIEVMVFRARGKQRKNPESEIFRSQEEYGISLPSTGLINTPQDIKFYDWILIDPKDKPYATFRFHYRSWDHLKSLQLVPGVYPRMLHPPSHSFGTLEEFMKRQQPTQSEEQDADEESTSNDSKDSSAGSAETHTLIDSKCKLQSILKKTDVTRKGGSRMHIGYASLKQTSGTPLTDTSSGTTASKKLDIPVSAFAVTQESFKERKYRRPLPLCPSTHSRSSSVNSNAVSIAPSLLPWVESESREGSPEHFIGVATAVIIEDPSENSQDYSNDTRSAVQADDQRVVSQLSQSEDRDALNDGDTCTNALPSLYAPTASSSRKAISARPPEAPFPLPDATMDSNYDRALQSSFNMGLKNSSERLGLNTPKVDLEDPFFVTKGLSPSKKAWIDEEGVPTYMRYGASSDKSRPQPPSMAREQRVEEMYDHKEYGEEDLWGSGADSGNFIGT